MIVEYSNHSTTNIVFARKRGNIGIDPKWEFELHNIIIRARKCFRVVTRKVKNLILHVKLVVCCGVISRWYGSNIAIIDHRT